MDWTKLTSRVSFKRSGPGPQALAWPFVAALGVVWVLTYCAGMWWVAQSSATQQRDASVAQAEMLADQLSTSVEPLLASEQLSSVRRIISEAGYQHQLADCKLMLADGRPLADADLDKPQMTVMPASWPENTSNTAQTRVVSGEVHVDRIVPVPGKGDATLSLVMPVAEENALIRPVLPGVAMVGLIGLAAGMLIVRKMRGRLAVLALIRGALRDASSGVPDLSALSVNPAWGAEAAGWNKLLADREAREQKEIDDELEASNSHSAGGMLEDACEGLGTGMMLTDSRGRVLYVNGAAAASLQIERDTAMGSQLTPMLTDEKLIEHIEQVQSGDGPGRVRYEMNIGNPAEPNTLRFTMRRVNDTGGLLMTIEDITQQRVSEASRHDFVNRATHELRTPLTNIRLYVETAQTDGEDDKELRGECLNVISRESQRLERLVSEMLSVSEIEAGSMTIRSDDVRLDQLFKSLEQDYKQNASQKNIDLRFDLPPKLPAVQGDRDKLAIVVQNLLGNAIKYTPEGGSVSVGVDLSATELNIEVRDSGIGISEEDQAHVFEKFYRANDPRLGDITGSGLGLALAHEIVRLHGGEMSVESVLNEGSTFRVVLPIRAEGM